MLSRERDTGPLRNRLEEWLRRQMPGAEDLSLAPLRKPEAGLSSETFLCDLTYREGGAGRELGLVLRLRPSDFLVFPEYDLPRQWRLLRSLAGSGVPVPVVHGVEEDESILGSPFYLMERIDGRVPSEVPPYHCAGLCFEASPAERQRMWWSGIEALARLHTLDWRARGLSFLGAPAAGTDALDRQIDCYTRYLRWVAGDRPQPILESALAWLRDNRYTPRRVGLCWGDARMPNLIFRDGEVAGVLDWEMAFLGDPEADLGWFLFMDWASCDGYGFPRLEGFPSREQTIDRYQQLTGAEVENAYYNEVFAALRFGVIMARVAGRMQELGLPTPVPDFERNNVCTQRLAALLELPPPGT